MRVARIIKEWNMAAYRAIAESSAARRLRPGECLVAFNKAETMAVFVDYAGGVHRYWAPSGTKYDLTTFTEDVERGLGIQLDAGQKTLHRARRLRLVA